MYKSEGKMAKKILVADDSPTIQKVVSITLSEEPFEIVECFEEKQLFNLIEEEDFDLILLDINLSEEKNGYKLSKEILSKSPESKMMLLLGTFDTVSEKLFLDSGAHEKIIKPFDSKRFVQKCRELLGDEDEEEYEEEEEYEDEGDEEYEDEGEEEYEEDNSNGEDDSWVVNTVNRPVAKGPDTRAVIQKLEENTNKLKLEKELGDWGGDLPFVIDEESRKDNNRVHLPPRIETLKKGTEKVSSDEEYFPSEGDLDYPEEMSYGEEELTKTPKFLSADELVPEEDIDGGDLTDPSFSLPDDLNRKLEDEVDNDLSPEDFWAVDEGGADKLENKIQEDEVVEKIDISRIAKDFGHNNDLNEKLLESFSPMIQEMVKEYCKKTIERVAWEIIPDLAENLIKQELKELSKNLDD
jgi:DNA-binding response OmpR family regulator